MTAARLVVLWLLLVAPVVTMATAAERAEIVSADHDAVITIDPATGTLRGSMTITVTGTGAVRLASPPWLTVEGFTLNGRPVPPNRVITISGDNTRPTRLSFDFSGSLRLPARMAQIAEEGTFLPASSGWFPRVAAPSMIYRVTARVPDPQRVVVTGRLESEATNDGIYEARFVAGYPPEGPSLFAGPYLVDERVFGDVRLRTYFYADIADSSAAYLDGAERYIDTFSERIGPYPFADFNIVAAPLPVGLGFANVIYIARQIVPQPFMLGRSLAHEILHNWWGNGVYVDYGSGNWAEGLTTYLADYAIVGEEDGADGQRAMRFGWLRDYAALPESEDIPAREFRSKHGDRDQVIGYGKVAFIFHMLRNEIGAEAFDAALQRLWREKQFEVAGWSDLQRAFEDESGRDLALFFRQWLDRAGAPRLKLADASADPADATLRLTIDQARPAYALTVPVHITVAGGGATEGSTSIAATQNNVELEAPADAVRVALDPDYDLFRHLSTAETPPIFRDVTLHPAAVAVVTAADAASATAANQFARALLGPTVRFLPPLGLARYTTPLLIVGTTEQVNQTLADAGFELAPPSIAGKGESRAWVSRSRAGAAVLAVQADDAEHLPALSRVLPHYLKLSRMAFNDGDAIVREVGDVGVSPLVRALSTAQETRKGP